jgi:hypothetical protein
LEVDTEIEIGASAEEVWRILSDLESYPGWNPFITKMTGKLEPGATLEGEASGEKASVTVLRVELNREIRLWTRFMPGLDGEHIFAIEPISVNRIRFRQDFYYRGAMIAKYAKQLEANSRRDAEAMNIALKKRAEHQG